MERNVWRALDGDQLLKDFKRVGTVSAPSDVDARGAQLRVLVWIVLDTERQTLVVMVEFILWQRT